MIERIALQVDHPENHRLLSAWLDGRYQVLEGDLAPGFDLCLLDPPALARLREPIAALKAEAQPLFLPFLLATRHGPRPLDDRVWALVDEVIFVPSEKAELAGRIEGLLRTRRLSLELGRRYEALRLEDRQKDEFLSVITHELRNPLTSILGYAEMLEDEIAGPLTDSQRDFVRQIAGGTTRVNRLVADLLDFARVETGTFKLRLEAGDLTAQLQEAISAMRPQAESAGVQLVASLPDGPMPVVDDPQRIVQVFVNLISNALKFTPSGGTIAVRARPDGDGLRGEVADDGPGIAPEDRGRLFKRFSQLESGVKKGGSGLGLSICKTIVEAHGGAIGVESTPGQGATFWFTLPSQPPAG